MKLKTNVRIYIICLIISILCGFCFHIMYNNSPNHAVRLSHFQATIFSKLNTADQSIDRMKEIIVHSSVDSVHKAIPPQHEGISFYILENEEMIYWSDNEIPIDYSNINHSSTWHFVVLPNAYCLARNEKADKYTILSIIKIKKNYPYENEELENCFENDFKISKEVGLLKGKSTDNYAIFDQHQNYLFTLFTSKEPINNELLGNIGMIFYLFSFLFLFILIANIYWFSKKTFLTIKQFSIIFLTSGMLVSCCLYFNFPTILFLSKLFPPIQYASNSLLASITHLSIATGFLISVIYLFYFHTNLDSIQNKTGNLLITIVFCLYFTLIFNFVRGIIYHSSIQTIILQFSDFSFITVWLHGLMIIWGVGIFLLFNKTHRWYLKNGRILQAITIDTLLFAFLFLIHWILFQKIALRISLSFLSICLVNYVPYLFKKKFNILLQIALLSFVYTGFILINSYLTTNNKKFNKYKVLAQNTALNWNLESDKMSEIMLQEMNTQILRDKKLENVIHSDSLPIISNYLNSNYLRGYWSKYEVKLNLSKIHSTNNDQYRSFIKKEGTNISNTHFYSFSANINNLSYIGIFDYRLKGNDSISFFLEFYPRKNFTSYSFPKLFLAPSNDILSKLKISIAKYEHNKLTYSSGTFEYPLSTSWISKKSANFYKLNFEEKQHYVYRISPHSYIVITETSKVTLRSYLLYLLYTFTIFYSTVCLLVWLHRVRHQKRHYLLGFTSKFQLVFVGLLIISFLGILYVSVNFINKKYREEQISNLNKVKSYVQRSLQEMYYWSKDINEINIQQLNLDLQDLAYIYHTDIHIFDTKGRLIASSQPLIFSKSLISNRITPNVYFNTNQNINQHENIGKLAYLCGYEEFLNGDFLLLGYIAIPQFLSQSEIQLEIENFLSYIIHIYLTIIILTILLGMLIGHQLSAPLSMLENKLKMMQLGQKNEKIEYQTNDEIRQLVEQYNKTIDELETSAALLAKSERESAWKTMARQVAHEINNPLTPMKLSIQQLQRTKSMNNKEFDDYFAKSTTMLIEQIDNLSNIAHTFSDFARMPEVEMEKVDIAQKLYSATQLFLENYNEITVENLGLYENVFVRTDSKQILQVFNNLLKNAVQSIPANRKGHIITSIKTTDNKAIITISDNGIGINDEMREKIFIPNFTTKNTGMGLGLAIAKNIVKQSGGEINFTTIKNEGSTFIIELPTIK